MNPLGMLQLVRLFDHAFSNRTIRRICRPLVLSGLLAVTCSLNQVVMSSGAEAFHVPVDASSLWVVPFSSYFRYTGMST